MVKTTGTSSSHTKSSDDSESEFKRSNHSEDVGQNAQDNTVRQQSTNFLEEQPSSIRLDGLVYTSVFNPVDGRKNFQDMVTGFCHAFKDSEDATLVLKFVNREGESCANTLLSYLYRLTPFQCRVVALSSFLSEDDYEKLIAITRYYVNTSHGEGQCLPLMEFMSCGKPAIAPANSALRDYIDDEVAFLVGSTDEPTHWQHDPRRLFRTHQGRIDWSSLIRAYRHSYEVAKHDPARYGAMSQACISRMEGHCSESVVSAKLEEAIGAITGLSTSEVC